jgi:hypothetical protein
VVEEGEKKELLVLLAPLGLVAILILQKIVADALDVRVDTLKVGVGVVAVVIEDKYVTGGEIVGGKHLDGLIIGLVLEPTWFLVELVEKEVMVDPEEVMIMGDPYQVLLALLAALIMDVGLLMVRRGKLVEMVEIGGQMEVIQQTVEMVDLLEEQFLVLTILLTAQLIPQQLKDCICHNKYF